MRFISQYPGFTPQIRPQRQRALGDGGVEITQEPLYAKFTSIVDGGFVYENEQTAALRHFTFHGNTQDEGEAIPTDQLNRLSVLDTDEFAESAGWSSEDKEIAESRLQQLALDSPDQVLVVTETAIAAPFPAYDRYDGDPQALMLKLIEDGHDLDKVLYYEQVFGKKRPEIVMWLEEAIEQRKMLEIPA